MEYYAAYCIGGDGTNKNDLRLGKACIKSVHTSEEGYHCSRMQNGLSGRLEVEMAMVIGYT